MSRSALRPAFQAAVVLVALGASACNESAQVAAPSETPASVPSVPRESVIPAGGPVVTLERTGCLGTCQAYTVSATAAGRVVFEGRAHVARVGTAEWRVAPSVVAGLVAAAEAAGHARAGARGFHWGTCATDHPSAVTTVRTAAGTTRVWHNLGCSGFAGEAALLAFESEIDRALGTAPYVARP